MLFRHDTFSGILFRHLTPFPASGACVNAELMCQCRRAGFRFAEVPVEHYERLGGRPTGSSLTVILRAFRELPHIQTEPLPPGRPSPNLIGESRAA